MDCWSSVHQQLGVGQAHSLTVLLLGLFFYYVLLQTSADVMPLLALAGGCV
jgi:hypothetical protein